MEDLRNRICRLIQAVKSPSGLQVIERCVQDVLGKQYNGNGGASSDSAGAAIPVPKAPPSLPGQTTLDFEDPDELQDWEEAFHQCELLLNEIDDLPEAAEDFEGSVRDKIESIQSWIGEHKTVTAKQLATIDNISAGVARWQR